MKLAENALERIEEQLGICLPASEKAGIALNIINSELTVKASNTQKEEELIAGCTRIIEAHLHQNDPSEFVQLRPVRDAHAVSASADQ